MDRGEIKSQTVYSLRISFTAVLRTYLRMEKRYIPVKVKVLIRSFPVIIFDWLNIGTIKLINGLGFLLS